MTSNYFSTPHPPEAPKEKKHLGQRTSKKESQFSYLAFSRETRFRGFLEEKKSKNLNHNSQTFYRQTIQPWPLRRKVGRGPVLQNMLLDGIGI